jgi:DNA-binding NtrC family response regulator
VGQVKHVLIVDDEPLVRQVVRRMLGPSCNVSIATNAEDAMEQIGMIEFDAVIADIELGGQIDRDGNWLLGQVAEKSPKTRRLLISGHHRTLEESGADGRVHAALPKPFSREDLFAALALPA